MPFMCIFAASEDAYRLGVCVAGNKVKVSDQSAFRALSDFADRDANATPVPSPSNAYRVAANAPAPDVPSDASVVPSGGSYDFTSISSDEFIKTAEKLFNSGLLSRRELVTAVTQAVHGNFLTHLGTPSSTGPRNFLGELKQELDYDKHITADLPSERIATVQSLFNKLSALQGTPKGGIDKSA